MPRNGRAPAFALPLHGESGKKSKLGGNRQSSQLDNLLTNGNIVQRVDGGKRRMGPTWEDFVTEHARNVIDAALRVVGNPEDANDVAQEVFLEIFISRRMVELTKQPALVRTIATRRALDRLRRRKRVVELNDLELDSREADPSENAVATELDQRLRDAIANLPPREAEVFCLSSFEGYSATEIAQLLNISKGAISKSLCSARARLSTVFGIPQKKVRQ